MTRIFTKEELDRKRTEAKDSIEMVDRIEELQDTLERVEKFVKAMETFCSPMGVATSYAHRLQAVIAGEDNFKENNGIRIL